MADYEIDEAEEEALLKSDDEYDLQRAAKKSVLAGLNPINLGEDTEDSLINEPKEPRADVDNQDEESRANDSDDDDDEMCDASSRDYAKLLSELDENKYAYDKYLRLCQLAHATGDLDNIRRAYNLFATVYPLAPELWLKFIKIEQSLAVSSEEISRVEAMFRRALTDYYSTELALEFALFAKKTSCAEKIYEEILGIYGCHCLKGQEFFKLYRLEHSSTTLSEELFIKSYLAELKLPLKNMEESYIEFKIFLEKNKDRLGKKETIDWQKIDEDYFKAKSHLEKILPYEEQLQLLDEKCYRERAEVYGKYIKEADDYLDENILQTIYERMVAECCLNPQCWQSYIDFIEERDVTYGRPEQILQLPLFQQSALDICSRALRNCTWSEKLYITQMRLMEKQEEPREAIQEVLESSLAAGFTTAEPVVAIWLEYLSYLRRHTNWENEEQCEILRKNFNLAWTILGQQWGVLADTNCEILQFWGRLEYGPLQDPKRGKELWMTVMESSDNATKSGLWIEFVQLEIHQDIDATRKLFRKALSIDALDNVTVILSAWERFERCYGSIDALKSCQNECTKYLMQYEAQHKKANVSAMKPNSKASKRKSIEQNENKSDLKKSKIQKQVHGSKDKNLKNTQEKQQNRQKSLKSTAKEIAFKEHENAEIDLKKDHLRIFLSNLDYDLNEDDIRDNLKELQIVKVDLIRSANGRSRGFGYLELANEAEVKKALELDRQTLKNRPLFISSVLRDKEKRQKFKYSDGVEPQKLFVKGLPNDTSKEEVERIFSKYGKLKDVRLVYQKSGKFKNIAYVEFVEEADAGKAVLGTDKNDFRGHTLSVAISAPPPKPTSSGGLNTNSIKSFALASKRNKSEQKPRMSLIPNVVRKQLTSVGSTNLMAPPPPLLPLSSNGISTAPKTNDDFRKLLEK